MDDGVLTDELLSKVKRPLPEQIALCDMCRLPWSDHTKLATLEAKEVWYELQEDKDEIVSYPEGIPVEVLSQHCVTLLLEAQRGPMGYPGITGATGARGVPGRDAYPAENEQADDRNARTIGIKDNSYGDHCGVSDEHSMHTWKNEQGSWTCMGTYRRRN